MQISNCYAMVCEMRLVAAPLPASSAVHKKENGVEGETHLLFWGSHTSICRAETELLTAALGATAILGATAALAGTGAWAALLAQATGAAATEEKTACILCTTVFVLYKTVCTGLQERSRSK